MVHTVYDTARDKLDRQFGYGLEAVNKATREDPVVAAVRQCALQVIVELIIKEERSAAKMNDFVARLQPRLDHLRSLGEPLS